MLLTRNSLWVNSSETVSGNTYTAEVQWGVTPLGLGKTTERDKEVYTLVYSQDVHSGARAGGKHPIQVSV